MASPRLTAATANRTDAVQRAPSQLVGAQLAALRDAQWNARDGSVHFDQLELSRLGGQTWSARSVHSRLGRAWMIASLAVLLQHWAQLAARRTSHTKWSWKSA